MSTNGCPGRAAQEDDSELYVRPARNIDNWSIINILLLHALATRLAAGYIE